MPAPLSASCVGNAWHGGVVRPPRRQTTRSYSGTEKSYAALLDELAAPDPSERREVAAALRTVAETFAEVPDGPHTTPWLIVPLRPSQALFLVNSAILLHKIPVSAQNMVSDLL